MRFQEITPKEFKIKEKMLGFFYKNLTYIPNISCVFTFKGKQVHLFRKWPQLKVTIKVPANLLKRYRNKIYDIRKTNTKTKIPECMSSKMDKQSETPLYYQPKRLNSNGICGTSKGTQRPNIVLRFLPN